MKKRAKKAPRKAAEKTFVVVAFTENPSSKITARVRAMTERDAAEAFPHARTVWVYKSGRDVNTMRDKPIFTVER